MREILFKAKRIDNGEWVEGYYAYFSEIIGRGILKKNHMIITNIPAGKFRVHIYRIDINSLCQYTGLTDKNENKIWENDICKYHNSEDEDGIAIIREDYVQWIGGTLAEECCITQLFYLKCGKEWEVIGNIFDNPELIEEKH